MLNNFVSTLSLLSFLLLVREVIRVHRHLHASMLVQIVSHTDILPAIMPIAAAVSGILLWGLTMTPMAYDP